MRSWHQRPRAAFDLETTGRDPHSARIVTASVVLVDDGGRLSRSWEWLARPQVPIPAEATAVHGISDGHARGFGQDPQLVTAEVRARLENLFEAGIPVLAFNAPYDFTVLASECRRYGYSPVPAGPVIDPFVLTRIRE